MKPAIAFLCVMVAVAFGGTVIEIRQARVADDQTQYTKPIWDQIPAPPPIIVRAR